MVTESLTKYAVTMQVTGEREASRPKMLATITAFTDGTKYEGIDADWLWRITRFDHPAILNACRAKNNEDRRVDWLTFKNITEWMSEAKQMLVDMGMVKDEPGIISEWLYRW